MRHDLNLKFLGAQAALMSNAWAVDGGGLPVPDGFAHVFLAAAAVAAFLVARRLLARTPVRVRTWGPVLIAAVPLVPIGSALLSRGHLEYLCESQAGAWQRVPVAEWKVPAEPYRSQPADAVAVRLASGDLQARFAGGLAEQWRREPLAMGATQVQHRLIDSSTDVLLAEAIYFNDERGRTPWACHRTNIFLVWRNQYIEKARRALAGPPAG